MMIEKKEKFEVYIKNPAVTIINSLGGENIIMLMNIKPKSANNPYCKKRAFIKSNMVYLGENDL